MFYVANNKIYLMERDNALGVYPEVKLVDGHPVVQETGAAVKPANRMICTLQEVLAQFGPNYPATPTVLPPKPHK